jgi:hypothetical protein
MSNIDASISTYSMPDSGHILVIPPSEETFLPHHSYVTLAICELDHDPAGGYMITIEDVRARINEIISQIHSDMDVLDVVYNYFNHNDNLYDLLVDLEDSGFITIETNAIYITQIQMEMLYLGLTDLFNY